MCQQLYSGLHNGSAAVPTVAQWVSSRAQGMLFPCRTSPLSLSAVVQGDAGVSQASSAVAAPAVSAAQGLGEDEVWS